MRLVLLCFTLTALTWLGCSSSGEESVNPVPDQLVTEADDGSQDDVEDPPDEEDRGQDEDPPSREQDTEAAQDVSVAEDTGADAVDSNPDPEDVHGDPDASDSPGDVGDSALTDLADAEDRAVHDSPELLDLGDVSDGNVSDGDVLDGAGDVGCVAEAERCNGLDDNCDSEPDDGLVFPFCVVADSPCPQPTVPASAPVPAVWFTFDGESPLQSSGSLSDASLGTTGTLDLTGEGAVGLGLVLDQDAVASGLRLTPPIELQSAGFTLAAWVRVTDVRTRNVIWTSKWDGDLGGLRYSVMWGHASLELGDGSTIWTDSVPIGAGPWVHVAAAFDGDTVTHYINGRQVARRRPPEGWGPYQPNSHSVAVGAHINLRAYRFRGGLDEVAYFDRALTGGELRRATLGGVHYGFEVSGRQDDLTGSGHDEIEVPDLERALVCGPAGAAWHRGADEPPLVIPDEQRLVPPTGLSLGGWIRPDSQDPASLVSEEGAFDLSWGDGEVRFEVTLTDESHVQVSAPVSSAERLWHHVTATFDATWLRLFVNGRLVAETPAGGVPLARSKAALVVAEGFSGALDEVWVRPMAVGAAEVRRQFGTLVAYDMQDVGPGSAALVDLGPRGQDLVTGSLELVTAIDRRYACHLLEAEDRIHCPHAQTSGVRSAHEAVFSVPLTLEAMVRVDSAVPEADPLSVFGIEGGPQLTLEGGAIGLTDEDTAVTGPTLPTDQWVMVSGVVTPQRLALYVDGTLEAEYASDADVAATVPDQRAGRVVIATGSEDAPGRIWVAEASILRGADEQAILRRHVPWHFEDHPRLHTHQAIHDLVAGGRDAFLSGADGRLAALSTAEYDVVSEDYSHWDRAQDAYLLAMAAAEADGSERAAYFDGALSLLEHLDVGLWHWAWHQGRIFYWYALAYDTLVPLLLDHEDEAPADYVHRHRRIRRVLASTVDAVLHVGGLSEPDPYYEYGLFSAEPGWLKANGRLLVLSGLLEVSLAMPEYVDHHYGAAIDWRALVQADLTLDRPYWGTAAGHTLGAHISGSGMYVEGNSYQNDVFHTATPVLLDWWQTGGPNHVTEGPVARMYDHNLFGLMPDAATSAYGTGWRGITPHMGLMAQWRPDREDDFQYVADRQRSVDPGEYEPAFSSIALPEVAYFRSGWDPDDTWLRLLGKTAPSDSGHTNADQMSIALFAHGAYLLIDPGDGRNYRGTDDVGEEEWMQGAGGHNNVLVDGEGPHFEVNGSFDHAEITLSAFGVHAGVARVDGTSGGAEHSRWVVSFGDPTMFAVVDQLMAEGVRDYAVQYHLGGPPDAAPSDGILLAHDDDTGFWWDTTNGDGQRAGLWVQHLDPDPLTLTEHQGGTNFVGGRTWWHPYVRLTREAESPTLFGVLATTTEGLSAPDVSVRLLEVQRRLVDVARADGLFSIGLNATGHDVSMDGVETDGRLFATDGGWSLLAEGRFLEGAGGFDLTATCHLGAAVVERLDDGDIAGSLSRPDGECDFAFGPLDWEPLSVRVDGQWTLDFEYLPDSSMVVFSPAPREEFLLLAP